MTIVVANSFNMFNANELEESASQLMDLGVGVQDYSLQYKNVKVVQDANHFHNDKIQQVGGVNGVHHCQPCRIFK